MYQLIERITKEQSIEFDYMNQAWVIDGRYIACTHPDAMNCDCYGTRHAGELANLPTIKD